jgi:predicted ArsR family transcriptional regulator
MDALNPTHDLNAIGLLLDPVRRSLYDYVCSTGREVSRNEAAEGTGVQRTLAAFHLDKLAEAGLLEATFRRLGERRGPGAGRPAKLYRRVPGEVAVSVPARDYQAVAHLLAETVDRVGADLELYASARRAGETAGRTAAAAAAKAATPATATPAAPIEVEQALAARGYEPYPDGEVLRLRNCPFGSVMREFPSLVCGMNLALVEGLLTGIGTPQTARMDPAPGRCCVAVSREPPSKTNQD